MKITLFAMLMALMTVFVGPAQAKDAIYTGIFSSTAVSGYDTVSYFSAEGPVKGKSEFSTQWKGSTWRFASADNLAKFKANPEKYAPQYGGYCAYAAAKNSLAAGDPEQWHIENGKLYLNINKTIKKTWVANKSEFIRDADQNFPALVQ